MWQVIVRFILRQRLLNLIIISMLTVVAGFFATKVTMSYEMIQMLRDDDPSLKEYKEFKQTFGEDGNSIFVGFEDTILFTPSVFNKWINLVSEIQEVEGVNMVMALPNTLVLSKNEALSKFDFYPLFPRFIQSQSQLDSLLEIAYSLPFYEGKLFSYDNDAVLMLIQLKNETVNSKGRTEVVAQLQKLIDDFSAKNKVDAHYSGLPYIRTVTSTTLRRELVLFLALSLLVAAISLFSFFKSWRVVLLPMIIVLINIIWALGIIAMFGFEITILTAIIPPILVIIGVENSIFLINKYHHEYRAHGNKILALSRSIERIGKANLLTNITTAIGFSAFIVTGNHLLVQFAIVAAFSILISYLFTLILLPIFFSYSDAPKPRHTRHLDNKLIWKILEKAERLVSTKRWLIYAVFGGIAIFALVGALKLKTSASVMDDVSRKNKMYKDMKFFEQKFKGVLPLEITIDTKKPKGVLKPNFFSRVNKLNEVLAENPKLSKPFSLLEVVKFGKQVYYDGDPDFYQVPSMQEFSFMKDYLPEVGNGGSGQLELLSSFMDSNQQIARVSVQMKDLTTEEILDLREKIRPQLDEIFDTAKYTVSLTGNSIVFLEGTNYLTKNLLQSLVFAAILISIMMFFLFSSWRMVILAIIPNLIPQLLTAGVMGYFDISIRLSTILIFSVALGVSVDNTIHFLSRYRLELYKNKSDGKKAVVFALGEAGFSMLYSSVILFLGFSMFALSSFGGTQWMGILVSLTLVAALFANLLLLPSLLLSLNNHLERRKVLEIEVDEGELLEITADEKK